jgi:putative addiction module component (TIGR02574 family)
MPSMSRHAAEVLDKALSLSSHERGLLIDRLIDSLDNSPPESGVEEAWATEIKRRVDEIRSGKVKLVPAHEMRKWFAERVRDAQE